MFRLLVVSKAELRSAQVFDCCPDNYRNLIHRFLISNNRPNPLNYATHLSRRDNISVDQTNGVFTDTEGKFRLPNVPLGRRMLHVTFLGYKEVNVSIVVTTGKEVVLEIELEQSVIQGKEVTITAEKQKDKPNNDMALVSA